MNPLIYESPNKGRTIYQRELGAPHEERVLIKDITVLIVGINPSDKEHYKNNTMKRLSTWMERINVKF